MEGAINMSNEQELQELAELEEELKKLESTDYGSPRPAKKDSTLQLFRDLIKTNDSRKVSNLDKFELHKTRAYLDVALYAEAEGLDLVSAYLMSKGENIFSTGMSKKGFFAQLLVTQIKKEQKLKTPNPEKKGWFSSKPKEETEE